MAPGPQAWFAEQLRKVVAQAGNPTQAQLLQVDSKRGLNKSTLSELLRGNFTRPPSWERIDAFATACVNAAGDHGISLPLAEVRQQLRGEHNRLVELVERAKPEPATTRSAMPAPTRRRFGAVPARAGAFQHRTATAYLMDTVDEACGGPTPVITGAATATVNVLTGLGGVGKTQLAANHSHLRWDSGRLQLLVWVSARSRDAITSAYIDVAVELLGMDPADPKRAWRRFLEWLAETSSSWLVVLDDLQDPADLAGLWPPNSTSGQVIVTTRRRDAALHGDQRRIVDVNLFTQSEALAYLTEKLPDRVRRDESTAELAGMAEDLGYLPLALAQAAAYLINKPLLSCTDYRAKLADQRINLEDVLPTSVELLDEYDRTVAATWSLSIDAADQLEPVGVVQSLMGMVSLLDPAGIPLAVFTTEPITNYLFDRTSRQPTTDDVLGGLECLRRFNLLDLDPDQPNRTIRVHTLVQRAVRDSLDSDALDEIAWLAADALMTAWPVPVSVRDSELVLALRSNVTALQDSAGSALMRSGVHDVQFKNVRSLETSGLVDSAISAAEQLHRQAATMLGLDHPDTLKLRGDLAWLRGRTGDLAGAIESLEQVVAAQLRLMHPDHEDILRMRGNLADARGENGELVVAITLLEQLLADHVRILGSDHVITLSTHNNLATWRANAGDLAGAIADFEQVATDLRRVLGQDHPAVLPVLHNIAMLRADAGDLVGATSDLEHISTEFRRVHGHDHPQTLTTRRGLAVSRGEAGDPARAVSDLQEILADSERTLGPDHLDNLGIRGTLAVWRAAAGDPAGAIDALKQLLTDRLRILGPNHQDTFSTRINLTIFRAQAGEPNRAITDLQVVIADIHHKLGRDHPTTLNTQAVLVNIRGNAGDHAGAVTEAENILSDCLQMFDPDHPLTLAAQRLLDRWRTQLNQK